MAKNYVKQRLKVFQSGHKIFDEHIYVCLEGDEYNNGEYFYRRDRNMRRIQYKKKPTDKFVSHISFGVSDTFLIGDPEPSL